MDSLAKIGIDGGSILIYLVNYGILLGVLSYFVYPKLIKIIDERREQIQQNLDEASRLRDDIGEQIKKHKTEKDLLMSELERDREALKKDLHDKKTEMVMKMDEERTKMMEETRTQIESEKAKIIKDAAPTIVEMIERVVRRILSTQVPEDVVKRSVQESWKNQK